MANALNTLLATWYSQKDSVDWVLGTIYQTKGPAYRKAGAMMLFSSDGQQLGMLSGGCLESDISRHARQVMLSQQPKLLTYDGTDEDDMAFQLGIGCGGIVELMLQPISSNNAYLQLDKVYQALVKHQAGQYHQLIPSADNQYSLDGYFVPTELSKQQKPFDRNQFAHCRQKDNQTWLITDIQPPVHILIAGGGIDARPVASIAKQLGWRVTVWDSRPANARAEYFSAADNLLKYPANKLNYYIKEQQVNAVVVMTHNVKLDAEVLQTLPNCQAEFIGLLGPINRRDKVLKQTQLTVSDLPVELCSPIGLDIGGQLPESIALSIIAQCHSVLHQKSALPLNQCNSDAKAINHLQLVM